MFRNHIKTATRYFSKNRTYTAINLLGLSIGMACFLLLSAFVKQEFSYDEFHTDKDAIYQVLLADTSQANGPYRTRTQAPMAPLLVASIPDVTNAVRMGKETNRVIKVGDQRFLQDAIHYADESLFEVFDFPFVASTQKGIDLAMGDIVISESQAIKLYGSATQAVGKALEIVDLGEFVVKEVFKDLPQNTHFDFEYLISFDNAQRIFNGGMFFGQKNQERSIFDWGLVSAFPIYVQLDNTSLTPALIERKIEETIAPHETKVVKLLPLDEIYFSEEAQLNFGKSGDKSYAKLYLLIALIILIVAVVNYMNMATARFTKRSKEVGIRKTIGGQRSQIIRQFLIESLLISLFSVIIGICLVEMAIPFFDQFIGTPVAIDYSEPLTLAFLVVFTIGIGLVSGIYPALHLSRFNPIQILSGHVEKKHSKFSFRQILVGFQLFACLGLMAATTVVYQQFQLLETIDKGFSTDQIVSIPLREEGLKEDYQLFKSDLLKNPVIKDVAGVSSNVFKGSGALFVEPEGLDETLPVHLMLVEKNFVQNMGIEMAEGEDFSQVDDAANNSRMIINEAAKERFAWDAALGKQMVGIERQVAGVAKDFIYGSAKNSIQPLMLWIKKDGFSHAYVKLSSADMTASLEHIRQVYERYAIAYPFEYSFLDDDFAQKYEKEQKLSTVFSTFSLLAILVAGLGILGLSIYVSEQRSKEMVIRRVLGARMTDIIWLLNKSTTGLILVAALVALPLVHYFLNDWLDAFSNRVSVTAAFYLIPLLVLTALVWSILLNQSLRTSRQDPASVLRNE